ncbi:MAG: F0F1 ATP synthase subunit delta [Candidatus Paceibacterales bacterium]
MHFLGKLGIDFKLLFAQIINFLVLLWLLKIFLYKPLIKNLEERAKKAKEIEQGEKEIQRKKKEMEKEEEEMIRKTKEKTSQILETAATISKEERERILEKTEKEVRGILKEAKERAEFRIKEAKEEEKEIIKVEAVNILKQVLSSSFSRKLHHKYTEDTLEELERVDFKKIKEKGFKSVIITSAFALTKEEKNKVKNILSSRLGTSIFEEKINPALIAGISCSIDGFFIDGSLQGKINEFSKT